MSSEYVATSDIPFGDPGRGVFAFRKGDRVPAEMVDEHGWQDHVVGAGTKEAQHVRAALTGEAADSGQSTTKSRTKQEG